MNPQAAALKQGQNPEDMGVMVTPHNQQNGLPGQSPGCDRRLTDALTDRRHPLRQW